MLPHLFLAKGHCAHANNAIQKTRIFPQYVNRSKGIEIDWTLPARTVVDEGGDEVARAVVEGDVVWVRRDASRVEGYEDVDRSGWGCQSL